MDEKNRLPKFTMKFRMSFIPTGTIHCHKTVKIVSYLSISCDDLRIAEIH